MAKLYVQETSICLEKENKEYTDICLCTYLRNSNWLLLGESLDDWGLEGDILWYIILYPLDFECIAY